MGALLGTIGGLASKALPWLAKNVLPAVLGGLGGGNAQAGATGQMQQPQNQFMPSGMMQSRQMPSYGALIQQMLAKYRG